MKHRYGWRRGGRRSESGFTLIELMIAVALLGVGLAFITNMFLNGWRLWKRSYDELLMQRDSRDAVAVMAKALREGSPGTVQVDSIGGNPFYSRISFSDGRGQSWSFRQNGGTLEYLLSRTPNGGSATLFLMRNVATLTFTYPNFLDPRLVEIGLVVQKMPFSKATPITIQLVERVMLRNP